MEHCCQTIPLYLDLFAIVFIHSIFWTLWARWSRFTIKCLIELNATTAKHHISDQFRIYIYGTLNFAGQLQFLEICDFSDFKLIWSGPHPWSEDQCFTKICILIYTMVPPWATHLKCNRKSIIHTLQVVKFKGKFQICITCTRSWKIKIV